MGLLKRIAALWQGIPIEDKGERRTRWLLTLLSFLMLSLLMMSAFVACLFTPPDLALALVDLVKHLSYVFGAVVGVYFGVESIFPSSDRPYFVGGNNIFTRKRVAQDDEPPVSPDANDAQVD